MKKISKNKLAQGILSLFAIIIFLASILAVSIYYEKSNEITGRAAGLDEVSG